MFYGSSFSLHFAITSKSLPFVKPLRFLHVIRDRQQDNSSSGLQQYNTPSTTPRAGSLSSSATPPILALTTTDPRDFRPLHLSTALANTVPLIHLPSIDMSCSLDKLAPETRAIIYEHVLSFDTPLKHVTKMQPFVKKLTGAEPKSDSGSTGSETETITNPQRVNTSLLTASKLIYVEAIAVFYKHNTIHFDAELYASEDIVSPRATDLSLAKHVVVEVDDSLDPKMYARFCKVLYLSLTTIPAIFPKLRTCSVHISADTDDQPLGYLIRVCHALQHQELIDEASFTGVGSITATIKSRPCIKVIIESRWTIDRWAKPAALSDVMSSYYDEVSASALYHFSRAPPQNSYAQKAQSIFNIYKNLAQLPALEDVEQDGYEFWTAVDQCLCYFQKLHP